MAGKTGGLSPHGADSVTVSRPGDQRVLGPSEVYTFGRAASCTASLGADDLGISRVAGSIEHDSGTWWVTNRSAVRPLTVVDEVGIRTVVAPGRRLAVAGEVTVVVEGASRRHAITVTAGEPLVSAEPLETSDPRPTAHAEGVVINDQDRRALVSLFAGYLEPFPRYNPFPRSYADAAAALGWPRSTLVKRVEYIRVRLTNAGVPNLLGETALQHLAEWALTTRVITKDDLILLRNEAQGEPDE